MRRFAAVIVMLAAAPAYADPPADVSRQPGALAWEKRELVTVMVDGVDKGDAVIVDSTDGDVLVPADLVCVRQVCRTARFDTRGEIRYVLLSSLAPHVTSRRVDGELAVMIAPEAYETTVIALGRRAPAELERPAANSLFVNYAAHGDLASTGTVGTALFGEAGLASGEWLYYASGAYSTAGATRGLVNATRDFPSDLASLVLGDAVVAGGALAGGGVITGIHLRRDFAIDPYFVAQPTLSQSGTAMTPSTIEVYRDGQLIRREAIPPGPFRVQDLVGTVGADTQVVLRDALGVATPIASIGFVAPAEALAPGVTQFDYSLGVAGTRPALFAVHRAGITTGLTLGVRAEATLDVASGGASAVIGTDRMALQLDVAGSTTAMEQGAAASVAVGWHYRSALASVFGTAASARYATIQLGPRADRPELEGGVAFGIPLSQQASLSTQVSARQMRDGDRVRRASVLANVHTSRSTQLQLSAAVGNAGAELGATFAWTFGTRGAATVGSNGASLSRGMAGGTGWDAGYTAQVGPQAAFVRAEAQSTVARASVSGQWLEGGGSDVVVDVAGGLVAIGGRVKATLPVQGGFALLRVPEASNVRGYVENRLIGRTDGQGDLLVPNLLPFYGNHLRVDLADLPMGVGMPALERVVATPRRGGVVVEMSAPRTVLVRGTIDARDAAGTVVDASFGELVLGQAQSPIGHGGAFEVEVPRAGTYAAVVQVEGRTCPVAIVVSAADEVEVGAVRCALGKN